ncbi:MAG: tetratricopeptide repeat protein [Pyrinomonadaceae bacterium]
MDPANRSAVVWRGFGVFSSLVIVFLFTQFAYAASIIEGGVYDNKKNALSDVHVELLNEYGSAVNRNRTDGSGRYRFDGLHDGRYSVRAMAFQYDLQDQTIPIEIRTQNIRGGEGTGIFQVDFYLLPKKAAFSDAELGVIFAQDVPLAAKKTYDKAIADLKSERIDSGISGLQEAVKQFPNYFDALYRLGMEFYTAKQYKEALSFFIRATEINPKSVTSVYYVGYSLHNLGKAYNKAAITALQQAYVMAPGSPQVVFALGRFERAGGNFADSEKHLLLAKKLAKVSVPEIHKELAQLYSNDLKRYGEAADELESYLKASKLSGDDMKKIRKVIGDLRAKAKSTAKS